MHVLLIHLYKYMDFSLTPRPYEEEKVWYILFVHVLGDPREKKLGYSNITVYHNCHNIIAHSMYTPHAHGGVHV